MLPLQAMCKRFYEYCQAEGIALPPGRGASLAYRTTIPRQCGLSGSSALAAAALNCLLQHYGVDIAVAARPQLVLDAEAALGIQAGLQDRVVQVYGGLVYMDFGGGQLETQHQQHEQPVEESHKGGGGRDGGGSGGGVGNGARCMSGGGCGGGGRYTSLDPVMLPPRGQLHLIFSAAAPSGKDSGGVHRSLRQRWLDGEAGVRCATDEARGGAVGKGACKSEHTAFSLVPTSAYCPPWDKPQGGDAGAGLAGGPGSRGPAAA